jgi:hypothetical protein
VAASESIAVRSTRLLPSPARRGVPDATAQLEVAPSACRAHERRREHDGRPRGKQATAVHALVSLGLPIHVVERVTASEFGQGQLRILHNQSLPGPGRQGDPHAGSVTGRPVRSICSRAPACAWSRIGSHVPARGHLAVRPKSNAARFSSASRVTCRHLGQRSADTSSPDGSWPARTPATPRCLVRHRGSHWVCPCSALR